jgi:hypothetical protein
MPFAKVIKEIGNQKQKKGKKGKKGKRKKAAGQPFSPSRMAAHGPSPHRSETVPGNLGCPDSF